TDSMLLFKEKKADWILITGGSGILFHQRNPEAEIAKKFLVQMGIPAQKILTESVSRNTAENVLKSSAILREKKMKTIILVTSAFHMKRTMALFKSQDFEITPFPTDYRALEPVMSWEAIVPSVGALDTTTTALKEWVGIFMYRLNGYI
ncbi:MAG: YdcF family protein, partial [Leptospira sp.]|nr:YdcF family protein [Leptospira sp.]